MKKSHHIHSISVQVINIQKLESLISRRKRTFWTLIKSDDFFFRDYYSAAGGQNQLVNAALELKICPPLS